MFSYAIKVEGVYVFYKLIFETRKRI